MKRISKKAVAVGLALGLTLGVAGAAFAFWTTTGSGTGTASTGSDTALTITQDTPYPAGLVLGTLGQDTQNIGFTIHNSSSSPEQVTSVAISVDPSFSAQANVGLPACLPADFNIVQPTWTPVEIPANGSTSFDSTGASIQLLDNTGKNQDNCKSLSSVPLDFASS